MPVDSHAHDLLQQIRPVLPEDTVGFYLHGSAARGGLRPHSDVDLLTVTSAPLADGRRRRLTETLLGLSGWAGHAERFPEAADRRPIELTVVVLDEVRGRAYPPTADFQFGEWQRAALSEGTLPGCRDDPDLVLLLADARQHHVVLFGQPLDVLVPAASPELLRTACRDVLPPLLAELSEDTRNVLLTLARMAVTMRSGRIVSKDDAAQHMARQLPEPSAALLHLAAAEYRRETQVVWSEHRRNAAAAETVSRLISA